MFWNFSYPVNIEKKNVTQNPEIILVNIKLSQVSEKHISNRFLQNPTQTQFRFLSLCWAAAAFLLSGRRQSAGKEARTHYKGALFCGAQDFIEAFAPSIHHPLSQSVCNCSFGPKKQNSASCFSPHISHISNHPHPFPLLIFPLIIPRRVSISSLSV